MVSRETDAPSESLLVELFGTHAARATAYVELLCSAGVERGLIGPREAPRIWQRHILNCVAVAPLFAAKSSLCDVGSGAGLPGLVIALARPDLRITLVEPLQRRASFLSEVTSDLELDNVTVVRARAEQAAETVVVDAVTARAVAPLETLARWCVPLLRDGGEVVALKGARAAEELAASHPALGRLGVVATEIQTLGGRFVQPPTTVVRLRSGSRTRHPSRGRGAP